MKYKTGAFTLNLPLLLLNTFLWNFRITKKTSFFSDGQFQLLNSTIFDLLRQSTWWFPISKFWRFHDLKPLKLWIKQTAMHISAPPNKVKAHFLQANYCFNERNVTKNKIWLGPGLTRTRSRDTILQEFCVINYDDYVNWPPYIASTGDVSSVSQSSENKRTFLLSLLICF